MCCEIASGWCEYFKITFHLYLNGYNEHMNYLIQKTKDFDRWHRSLRDLRAKVAVARRIDRAANGNLGDTKSVGEGVSELRIDIGSGYRVYYTMR